MQERLAEVTDELERKRASTMPRLKELEAARARVEAQSKDLARLNAVVAALKAEQNGRKKRKGAPRAAPAKEGAACAAEQPSTSPSSESGEAQVESAAVVELEREVVTLRAEKALAADQAQLKISKLEQVIVGAGLEGASPPRPPSSRLRALADASHLVSQPS